jgi:tripartite-type tricarboxylate transporter receptor subunit TctC
VLSRRTLLGGVLGGVATARSAFADTSFPTRAIRVVSPFPPGSASDTTGRVVLDALSNVLGQPMVVENRPGAGTVAEAGYPSAESNFWVGLSAPAKTPSYIVNKLHDATEQALQVPAVKEKLAKLGVDPELMSIAEFKKFFRDDLQDTVQLAQQASIHPVD